MSSREEQKIKKPHAVCVPLPAQGHINPMLKVAKLLHHRGFHITFVNTDFNHRRILNSRGPHALDGLPSFEFATISDGLPPSNSYSAPDFPILCDSIRKKCLPYFKELLTGLSGRASSGEIPPVSCIVSDGVMSFTVDAAQEIGVPQVLFWTNSACSTLGYMHYHRLVELGYTPLKAESYLTNGYLYTPIDWIPGMKNIRLKDLPSFIRTTDPDDIMMDFLVAECERSKRASAIILNTFDALESDSVNALKTILPPIYTLGPLHLLLNQVPDSDSKKLGSNLWKEEEECLEWLDSKEPNSVVYVNFGSITVVTQKQLLEFAWGLANSNETFLWVIRPDLVSGQSAMLNPSFLSATKERSMLSSWCPQEAVLKHPSVGGFLTHCGWNSTLETLSEGVAVVCWPFFSDQQTNCRYCCTEWGIGMEIDSDVKSDDVEVVVRELMKGEKGKEMKRRAMEWKKMAEEATVPCSGSSYLNLEKLISDVLLSPEKERVDY